MTRHAFQSAIRALARFVLAGALLCAGCTRAQSPEPVMPATVPIGESFGVQVQSWYVTDADLALIAQTGFGRVRWGISWDKIETRPGVYDWAETDRFFARLRAAGLKSVIILGQGNPIYTGTIAAKGDEIDARTQRPAPPSTQAHIALFARFAAAAAQRYAGEGVIWEIWNEPDLATFWPPYPQPKTYADLAGASCRAIKAADPHATVIGPAGAAMPEAGTGLMSELVRSDAMSCLDAVSGHAYRMKTGRAMLAPETVQADNVRSLAWLKERTGRDIAYDCSEWGYAEPLVTARQQADYPLRAHLSNLLSGVPLTVWYEWKDSRNQPGSAESHYGLLEMNGHEKPGFAALFAVLPKIRDAVVVRRIPSSDMAYLVLVRQPAGDYGLVYWSADSAPTYSLAINGQVTATVTSAPAYRPLGAAVPEITVR